MIPKWKLKREVLRIGAQISGLPRLVASLPMRLSEPRRREEYERDFDNLTRLTEGHRSQTEKVAVFLIFQPKGVANSVLDTCHWLEAEGYSTLVVSNGFLDDASRSVLAEVSWKLFERPNFGYDFGGYRDGIRLLWRWGLSPKRLIVMNDSVWLPMVPDLMDRLEAKVPQADIVGLLQDEKVRHDTTGGYETPKRHIESYFYLFTSPALTHPEFRVFWTHYRMTDFKPHTIKFGELQFSRRMAEAGLRLEALTRRSVFLERLAEQDNAFIQQTLQYASYADPDLAREAVRLASRSPTEPDWRSSALEHIRRAVNRKRFNSSFPFANDRIFGTLFMKKSNEPIFVGMRDAYLRAIKAGEIKPPPSIILSEITAKNNPGHPPQSIPPWAIN